MELGHLLTRSCLMYPEVSSKVVMRNTIAYSTQKSSSPSRGIPYCHKRGNDDRVTVA